MRRFLLAIAGVLPVSLIGASTFGVVGLRVLAVVVLLPALVMASTVTQRRPSLRHEVARAVGIGVVATACYDVVRFSFLGLGLMARDPIPHIGAALGLQPAWLFGYLWRYFGNGGGLAVAFVMLGLRGRRAGAIYGSLVCAGLLTVLLVSPLGTTMLFPLNATTVVMAVSGHLVYGLVLGHLVGTRLAGPVYEPVLAAAADTVTSRPSSSSTPVRMRSSDRGRELTPASSARARQGASLL